MFARDFMSTSCPLGRRRRYILDSRELCLVTMWCSMHAPHDHVSFTLPSGHGHRTATEASCEQIKLVSQLAVLIWASHPFWL